MEKGLGYVWVPHPTDAWLPALFKEEANGAWIYHTEDGQAVEVKQSEVKDRSKLERVSELSMTSVLDNLVNLDDFSEGGVVHQLRKRYKTDEIYTNISTILVSINPYKLLPIYHSQIVESYRQNYTDMPPHVYKIAAEAYKRLLDDHQNQAVVISGESGAGKTEATKAVLQYLSDVAGSSSGVEQQILQSNPVLEAFGNAKTVRNNNSSRFGKWMEVNFAPSGRIVAASVINYLLEKSRVTKQSLGERNYHVFYQVCQGLEDEKKAELGIKDMKEYLYLQQSGNYTIDGVNDSTEFELTRRAMKQLQFTEEEVHNLWVVISLVLNVGNLTFNEMESKQKKGGGTGSEIKNKELLTLLANLLKLEEQGTLETALTFKVMNVRGSVSMIPMPPAEAEDARDALAKSLYGRLFDWLIERINLALRKQVPPDCKNIGILDIFGFEIFERNDFEQFCINYANEKLQQHFNEHIFKIEQAEYQKEEVVIPNVDFVDNLECIKMLEDNPGGILIALDEEVIAPGGSDKNFIGKLHQKFGGKGKDANKYYAQDMKKPQCFSVKHYAGAVTYDTTGWLGKNRDKMPLSLEELVTQSGNDLVRVMFAGKDEVAVEDGKKGGASHRRSASMQAQGKPKGKKKDTTLGAQFKQQLQSLVTTLKNANPHYIRCIKPNAEKIPNKFDAVMILRQMRYSGLFEAIRIRRAGFPFRKTHEDFAHRYRVILNKDQLGEVKKMDKDYKGICDYMLNTAFKAHTDSKDFIIGKSKVLMRNSQLVLLTKLRDNALTKVVLTLQSFARKKAARKQYKKKKAFHIKCAKSLENRVIDELKAILKEADNESYDLFILRAIKALLAYLEEERRVRLILEAAIEQNEISVLTAGLEQVAKLKETFKTDSESKDFTAVKQKATDSKDDLVRKDKARKALAAAVVSEKIPELEAAVAEAQAAKLQPDEWKAAETLLSQLKYEAQLIQNLQAATESATNNPPEEKLDALEAALKQAETITIEGPRVEIVSKAKETLAKGWYATLKAVMNKIQETAKNHLSDHTETRPFNEIPIPAEEKHVQDHYIPKLNKLGYDALIEEVNTFLLTQSQERGIHYRESHFKNLQEAMDLAKKDVPNHKPDHTIITPLKQLPLPTYEKKIREVIIPNLKSAGFPDFVFNAEIFLQSLLKAREAVLRHAHEANAREKMKAIAVDAKKYFPDHTHDAVPTKIPADEQALIDNVLPIFTKLNYTDLIKEINNFLTSQQQARVTALAVAHTQNLEVTMKKISETASQYMPTMENDSLPADLPPEEKKLKDEIIPKLVKLEYKEMVEQANTFLEAQKSAREVELARIKAEKAEIERKKKEEEERKRREAEIQRLEEEARKKAEEEERKRQEEERIRREEEKRKADEEARIKRELAEQKQREALEQARIAQEKRMEELRREEEARKKALEEAEAAAKAEEEKRIKEAEEMKRQLEEAAKKEEEQRKAAEKAAAAARAELEKKEFDIKSVAQEEVIEEKEKQLEAAVAKRDLAALTAVLKDYKSQTRVARSAIKLKNVLEEEQQIIESLTKHLAAFEAEPMKELLKKASLLELNHPVIAQAREVAYGMKPEEVISKRIHVLLEKRDAAGLKVVISEAKELGIENADTEHAQQYVSMKGKQSEHKRRSVIIEHKEAKDAKEAKEAPKDVAKADAKAELIEKEKKDYQSFLSYAGLFPLRACRLVRKEGEYAKGKPKELRILQFVWQKDKLPSTLIKLDIAACGSEAKSKMVKKVARLLFQNINGYMGDRFHAYPVTLAYQVLTSAEKEPLLRDEVYAQLIKQTTNHPISESEIYGWKLIYLCLLAFAPGQHMKPVLLSHIAASAPADYPESYGWKTISDFAFHCWYALKKEPTGTPTMDFIQAVTNGTLDPVPSPFQ